MKKRAHLFLFTTIFIPLFLYSTEISRVEIEPVIETEEEALAFQNEKEAIGKSRWWGDLPIVYYPSSIHWAVKVSVLRNSLELEDGSVWEGDASPAAMWRSSDPLFITQNWTWFSSYKYKITNRNTGDSIPVNLKLGPYESSGYTHFISIIDRYNSRLALTDSTNWDVCPKDLQEFNHWREDQAVIVGINTGWFSSYDVLLINVNRNKFIRAKQF